jgi:nucleotide sugar dehydrogenase
MQLQIRKKLVEGECKVAIWGTGYIGFSTMANFAAQGVSCVGTDVSESVVATIQDGRIPVPNMEYWLGFDTKYLVENGVMKATTDWKQLLEKTFAVHMVAIPTEKEDKPWDGALEDVIRKIANNYSKTRPEPAIVVIESTLTPGKTDELVIPILSKAGLIVGKDIHVAVAPRRDWFISAEKSLRTLPRIVGGTTQETTQLAIEVLGIVCDNLIPAPDHRHAEIVKSVENAYRHVEITLANQLSLAYPSLDMTEILRLVGTKWNVGTFHPSFGSGGYCIPLSSQYVLAGAEHPEHLTILRETIAGDSSLPLKIADRVVQLGFRKIGILGLSYKGDLKVHVLSPTIRLAKRLQEKGATVKVNDPYFTTSEIMRLTGAEDFAFPDGLKEFDCILIVAGHRLYRAVSEATLKAKLTNCKMIIDNMEEVWRSHDWKAMGIKYKIAGSSDWLG